MPSSCLWRGRTVWSARSTSSARAPRSRRANERLRASPPPISPGPSRAERADGGGGKPELTRASLELLGEVLAAGADESETAEQVVRLAAEATGASAAAVWRVEADADPFFLAGHGIDARRAGRPDLTEDARRALREPAGGPEVKGGERMLTLPLGEPPLGGAAALLRPRTARRRAARTALALRSACVGRAQAHPPGRAPDRRAQALADAHRRRQPGDRAALARAHPRDGGGARRRAHVEQARRRVPARGRTAFGGGFPGPFRSAHRARGAVARAGARPPSQPGLSLHRGHGSRPEALRPRRPSWRRAASAAPSSSRSSSMRR